jgi:hypothetical protein
VAASSDIVRLASGDTVQVRAGLVAGVGPAGPIGPVGPQGEMGSQGVPGQPGQTNLFASFISGPVSATLPVPVSTWTNVPLPSNTRNDLLATPLSQAAFSFTSAGLYLVIARAHFDSDGSTPATGYRELQLVTSSGTVLEHSQAAAVTKAGDSTDVTLVKFINDPGTGTLYNFQVQQDDTTSVNLSDIEVQIVLCGSGPEGVGVSEVASGVVNSTTPLSGFAAGVTYSQVLADSTMPETAGILVTLHINTQGEQTFYATAQTGTQLIEAYTRTWDTTNSVWLAWALITPAFQGPTAYTPVLKANGAALSVTSALGEYTKIGKLVLFSAFVTLGSTFGPAGSTYTISLPFVPSSTANPVMCIGAASGWTDGPSWFMVRIASNIDVGLVLESGQQLTGMGQGSLGGARSGANMYFQGQYYVA